MLKNTKTGKQHKTTHSFRYLAAFVALKKKNMENRYGSWETPRSSHRGDFLHHRWR